MRDRRTATCPSEITWEGAREALEQQIAKECLEASEFVYNSPHVPVFAEITELARRTLGALRRQTACERPSPVEEAAFISECPAAGQGLDGVYAPKARIPTSNERSL